MLDKVPSSRVVNFRDYVTVPKQNEYENVTLVTGTGLTGVTLTIRRFAAVQAYRMQDCSVTLQFMNC